MVGNLGEQGYKGICLVPCGSWWNFSNDLLAKINLTFTKYYYKIYATSFGEN